MKSLEDDPQLPVQALPRLDRITAEALGYRCMTASEYARLCGDEALLRQLQTQGLL